MGREEESGGIIVYNLEVTGTHTYFAGRGAAWVHNTCNAWNTWEKLLAGHGLSVGEKAEHYRKLAEFSGDHFKKWLDIVDPGLFTLFKIGEGPSRLCV